MKKKQDNERKKKKRLTFSKAREKAALFSTNTYSQGCSP